MKTYSIKPGDITRKWYILDASTAPLGRISTRTASLLIGKGKPMFSNHIDPGDYVIIINTDSLVVTGDKVKDKAYYRHSGFPGGITKRSLGEVMQKDSTEALFIAVRGMLPVNKLRDARLQRLKLYKGAEHGHNAQKPEVLSIKFKEKT